MLIGWCCCSCTCGSCVSLPQVWVWSSFWSTYGRLSYPSEYSSPPGPDASQTPASRSHPYRGRHQISDLPVDCSQGLEGYAAQFLPLFLRCILAAVTCTSLTSYYPLTFHSSLSSSLCFYLPVFSSSLCRFLTFNPFFFFKLVHMNGSTPLTPLSFFGSHLTTGIFTLSLVPLLKQSVCQRGLAWSNLPLFSPALSCCIALCSFNSPLICLSSASALAVRPWRCDCLQSVEMWGFFLVKFDIATVKGRLVWF